MTWIIGVAACHSSESAGEPSGSGASSLTGKIVLADVDDASAIVVTLSGPVSAAAVTDGAGTYSFDSLPPGRYALSATATSTRERSVSTVVDVAASAPATAPNLSFTALGDLTGTADFGRKAGNAGIAIVAAGTSSSTITDDGGTFVLHDVPAGLHDIIASYPGFAASSAKSVRVKWKRTETVPALVLAPAPAFTGGLSGKVVVTGETDASGIAITASGPVPAAAITDATGTWSITNLPDGAYSVVAIAPSTLEGARSATTKIEVGKPAMVPDLAFTPVGNVQGTVTLAGKATGNAGILVWVDGAPAAYTDDAGAYVLHGVTSGVHTLRAAKEGYTTGSESTPTVPWRATVTADALALSVDTTSATKVTGIARIVDSTMHDGTKVTLGTVGTLTAADGTYDLEGVVGSGLRTLSFDSKDGLHQHRLNDVLLVAGSYGFLMRGTALFPVPAVTLPRGRWLADGIPLGTTPDSHVISLVPGTPTQKLVSVTKLGSATTLVEDSIDLYNIRLSANSNTLFYMTLKGSARSLYSVSAATGGSPALITAEDLQPLPIDFSPDGARYFYASRPTGSVGFYTVYARNIATGTSVPVMQFSGSELRISPNGAWLAAVPYSYYGTPAWTVGSVAGGPPITGSGTFVRWLSDSRVLYSEPSSTGAPTQKILDPATGTVVSLGAMAVTAYDPISADGKWALTSRGADYGLLSLTGTATFTVLDSYAGSHPAAFSPDSTRFFYGTSSSTGSIGVLAKVSDPITGAVKYPVENYVSSITFCDGGSVVIEAGYPATVKVITASGTAFNLATSPYSGGTAISPDRKRLAFIDGSVLAIATLDATVKKTTVTVHPPIVWSPDSKQILVAFDDSTGTWRGIADATTAAVTAYVPSTSYAAFTPSSELFLSDMPPASIGYPTPTSLPVASGIWWGLP